MKVSFWKIILFFLLIICSVNCVGPNNLYGFFMLKKNLDVPSYKPHRINNSTSKIKRKGREFSVSNRPRRINRERKTKAFQANKVRPEDGLHRKDNEMRGNIKKK